MLGFDYGNARLRAMKSRLLTLRELENLAGAGSLAGLITALTKTAYRKPIESALARTSGMDCINEALQTDLVNTLGKMRSFYHESAGEMVNVMLLPYDLHNLITILRGLGNNIAPDKILATLLPVGELDLHTLSVLSGAPGVRAAIDIMASMNLPFAVPIMRLRSEVPGASIPWMESALQGWYWQQMQAYAAEIPDAELFEAAINLEADLINLRTVLRFIHAPRERVSIKEQTDNLGIQVFFIGPGRLSFTLLEHLSQLDDIKQAVELLSSTNYYTAIRDGLEAYHTSGRLSDFERQLNRFRLNWMASLINQDPLGIGLVLGYLALKVNEIGNLRWIANGISLDLKSEEIIENLAMTA